MAQYLINIAVGPVQEFIASARKLRDLWYGSFLLSELSKSVARSLSKQGCELIFPDVGTTADLEQGSALNVANKILALAPGGSDPKKMVASARRSFEQFWANTSNDALEKALKILPAQNLDQNLFKQQVADFGEFFAAWTELDPENYAQSRKRCEQLLAGRKNLREFMAPAWDGAGKAKSSLDGIRESVFQQTAVDSYIVKQGEQLDALGIVKRFGPLISRSRPCFDSMAQVAALPWLEGLQHAAKSSAKIAQIINSLPSADTLYLSKQDRPPVSDIPWDGWPKGLSSEIVFPSIVAAECRQRTDDDSTRKPWQQLEKELQRLWKKTAEPMPYSCLLVGDGDKMGATLNRLGSINQHQQFSSELDNFARKVHPLVQKFKGRVIYSGGDDIMAYAPLHTAIDCAVAVNDAFAAAMDRACTATSLAGRPTFSLGLVIVHQHIPLHQILELARTAEKHAKNEGGRNSITIIQSKRSGSDLVICGKWNENKGKDSLITRLSRFSRLHSSGSLSSRLGYQLRSIVKECGRTMQWSGADASCPDNVTAAEALRTIGRKRQQSGDALAAEDAAAILAGQKDLRQVSDELIIAQQISAAADQATAVRFKIN